MFSRLIRTRGSYGDWRLALLLAIAAVTEVAFRHPEPYSTWLALSLFVPLALLWRVKAPLPVLVVTLIPLLVERLSSTDDVPVTLGIYGLVATYSVAAHAARREATAAGTLLIAVLLALTATRYERDNPANALIGLIVATILYRGAWLAGEWAKQRRARQRELLAEREEHARALRREERARIGRELHDILAHALSVVVLQARGARHALAAEPQAARGALDAIERTASQALVELRRLLGVLRSEEEAVALTPQPSLSQVEALVGEVRAAGLPVDLKLEGEARELPPGVDLCAYRIVQEALTNALKHAGPARAHVLVRYADEALEVQVADTGRTDGPADNGEGLGLAGMRERVAIFGGRLESGPRPDGGYLVKARLPL